MLQWFELQDYITSVTTEIEPNTDSSPTYETIPCRRENSKPLPLSMQRLDFSLITGQNYTIENVGFKLSQSIMSTNCSMTNQMGKIHHPH